MNKTDPICPMLTTNTVISEDKVVTVGTQPVICVKEMCAWWIEDKQRCAIAAIGGKKNAN